MIELKLRKKTVTKMQKQAKSYETHITDQNLPYYSINITVYGASFKKNPVQDKGHK